MKAKSLRPNFVSDGALPKSLTATASMEVNVLPVCNVLSAYLCDTSAARRFIGFTDVITAEVRRTAEIRREDR
jgi:hypothetical protein